MADVATYNKRLKNLESERSGYMDYWGELSDYHLSHRGRFLISDTKKGHKRNTKQINNTSRLASRTLSSGMMAGITSPARPWFKLAAADPRLNNVASVKAWNYAVEQIMYRVFSASNTYNSLHSLYAELGTFGTADMGVFEDFENVIRCKTYTIGSYMLGINGRDEVDTHYREYQNTVGQVVKRFGLEQCSQSVQNQWNNGNTEAPVNLVHVIEPNDNRDQNNPLAKFKKYRSVYYEKATKNKDGKLLLESGFDDFPNLTPRWDITGEDIYSNDCPGMVCLGDTKSLQLGEKRKAQAEDKVGNPALLANGTVKTRIKGQAPQPGEIVTGDKADDTLTSIYGNYRPDINALKESITEKELRIKRAYYEDLFLMLANSDRRQITAREVAEKQEEKLLMLGPVLERLHTELLSPLINRVFNILQKNGVLPVAPQELQDQELTIQYVSILAQAQRMVTTGALENTVNYAASLTQVWPEARHKIDALQSVDDYADAMGINPKIVRSDDEAQELAEAEQEAMAQAQANANAQAGVETAKTASEINTGGGNAVGDALAAVGLG